MTKENLLLWHVGLGDALICNGLVRELHNRRGQVTLPVLPKYQKTIEWMFGDLPGVTLLPLLGFDELTNDLGLRRRHLHGVVNLADYNEIAIGLLNQQHGLWQGGRTFDRGFYDQAGVPFNHKWSHFGCRRHPDQIAPPREPYVFLHMDASRKYTFDPHFDPTRYRVITNLDHRVENLFQWQEVLEQAQEIHVMESAFSNWLELMPAFRPKPMFVYDAKHMHGGPGFPVLRQRPWKIVPCWCATPGLRLNVRGRGNAASLATAESPARVATITITIERSVTTAPWDMQLRKLGLPLEAGLAYELSFRARTESPRDITFGINDHQFNDLGMFQRVTLSAAWQTFRGTIVPAITEGAADVHFDLNGPPGIVQIEDIALSRVADGTIVEPDGFHGCACWPLPEPEPEDA